MQVEKALDLLSSQNLIYLLCALLMQNCCYKACYHKIMDELSFVMIGMQEVFSLCKIQDLTPFIHAFLCRGRMQNVKSKHYISVTYGRLSEV
ncbi:hypothetical protein VINE108521_11265 [Vibrio neonatus]